MFVLYGLMMVAMIFGLVKLLKPSKTDTARNRRTAAKNIENSAHTNDGGNSQRAENTNHAGSIGQSDYGMNSMGADNDEDNYRKQPGDKKRKEDFENYQ